jgi:hypothetical protein
VRDARVRRGGLADGRDRALGRLGGDRMERRRADPVRLPSENYPPLLVQFVPLMLGIALVRAGVQGREVSLRAG